MSGLGPRALLDWFTRRPEISAMALVAAIALLARGAFLFRSPVLLTGDSESYLAPAFQLARGAGFDLSLKRTPAYPLFLAWVIAAWSEDLRAAAFAQHALGVATAVLAYLLGRMLFSRAVGLGAGLMTGLNGALLLSEHSIMTEALFVPLVAGTLAALVVGLRTGRARYYALAGAILGIAALTRPVAQALIPIVPLAIALAERRAARTIRLTAAALAGFALIVLPWMARSAAEHDTATVGSLGQSLVGRTARHDRGAFVYYDPALHGGEDPARVRAREILQEAADRGSSGKAVHTRLRRELGLDAAQADALMRDLALDAILRQPGYYLSGTLQRFIRLSLGSIERFGAYRSASNVAIREWENEETRHLVEPPTPAEERATPIASALIGLYQPGMLGPILPGLALLAVVLAAGNPRGAPETRAGVLATGLACLALLGASAALVGNVSRYRFPEDPLIAVLGLGGLQSLASAIRSIRVGRPGRHARRREPASQARARRLESAER